MRKEVREECSVNVSAIPVAALIKWNCTVRWLPSKRVAGSMFLSENSNTWPKLLFIWEINEPEFFWQVWGCNNPGFTLGKKSLTSKPNFHVTGTCLHVVSGLYKDIPRTHHTIPWEKRLRESVLWLLTAVSRFGETVLSDDFRGRVGKKIVSFIKLKYLTKVFAIMKRKMTKVFSWQVWECNYPGFTVEKYCFWHQAPIPRFRKHVSLQFKRCVKIH